MQGRGRIARLLQLLLALGAGRCPNARQLAEACEVSRRTIYRDLDVLELAGVPVRYRPDRQGYELPSGYAFTPPALDELEAAALLVAAGQADDGLGLAPAARTAARKLFLTLPTEVRERVRGLLETVGPHAPVSPPAPDRRAVHEAILQSLGRGLQVRAWSIEVDGETPVVTKLSPYRLTRGPTSWALLGRSSLHRAVRSFSVARIVKAELTDDPYAIPPRFAPARDFASFEGPAAGPRPPRLEVLLRISRRIAPEFLESPGRPLREVARLGEGAVAVRFDAASLDEALDLVLPLADQVEVLAPPELRARLAEVAGRIGLLHAPPGPARPPELRAPGAPSLAAEPGPGSASDSPGDLVSG